MVYDGGFSFTSFTHFFFSEMCVCEMYGNEGKLEEGNREKTKMAKI